MGDEQPLADQVALVTGGGSGIGRATARALADAGAIAAVVDRDEAGAGATVDAIDASGGAAASFVADLGDAGEVESVVDAVLERFGRIDILVNCAGTTGGRHSALEFDDEQFDLVMRVNVRAPFLLTRAVGRHMVARGGGGRIVNLSSSGAFRATSAPALYAASKSAINGLTRASAADLGRHGVNVNAVAPGMTKTPMTASIGDDDAYERVVSSGPLANLLHRASEPEDVAEVIVFLCLPASRQITGQVVHTSAGLVV